MPPTDHELLLAFLGGMITLAACEFIVWLAADKGRRDRDAAEREARADYLEDDNANA